MSRITQLTFIFTQEAQSSVQVFTIGTGFLGSVFEIEAPTNMPTHLYNHLWFFSPSFKCCLNIPEPLKAVASVLCSAGVHTSFLVVTAVPNTV